MTVMVFAAGGASGGALRGACPEAWAEDSSVFSSGAADIKSERLDSLLMEMIRHSILNAKSFALKTGADNAVLY
jgi:hypothetical protein